MLPGPSAPQALQQLQEKQEEVEEKDFKVKKYHPWWDSNPGYFCDIK